MITLAYFLLQVIVSSGVMLLYYWLFLRNEKFHQYNRFYLLALFVLPWFVPLCKIQLIPQKETATTIVYFAQAIADNNTIIESKVKAAAFNWNIAVLIVYAIVSGIILIGLIKALVKIYELLKHNRYKHLQNIYLVFTNAKGTPFSFFKYIFWNNEINLESNEGKRMLQHELIHVQHKHSIDKLLMQVVLIIGWCNPFFLLAKKEMNMIHEFIADNKVVKNGDASSLAAMLLAATFPQQKFSLTNPFFFSPIKRRLAMITNNKNTKFSYARRIIALPVLFITVLLFSFRNTQLVLKSEIHNKDSVIIENITLKDVSPDNNNISKIDSSKHITNVYLSSTKYEVTTEDGRKINLPKVDTIPSKPQSNTIQVTATNNGFIKPKYDSSFKVKANANKSLDSALIVVDGIKKGKGYNNNDYLNKPNNIKSINIIRDEEAIKKYGKEGKDGVIEIYTDNNQNKDIKRNFKINMSNESKETQELRKQLDEATKRKQELNKEIQILQNDVNKIDSISNKKSNYSINKKMSEDVTSAIKRGKEDSLVKAGFQITGSGDNRVFTQVIIPAEFPGGKEAWGKYLTKNLNAGIVVDKGGPAGKYIVKFSFIVNEKGEVSNVKALNDPGYGTKEEALRLMKNCIAWLPAVQNGHKVSSLVKKEITFQVSEEN